MFQYYILNREITDIGVLRCLEKLKKTFHYEKQKHNYIVSNEGMFYIENGESILKYILTDYINPIVFDISNLKLVQQEYPFKKINKEFYSIPLIHTNIPLTYHVFKPNKKSNFQAIFVEKNDNLIDFYILSELENTDFNFKEDISYFLRMLM